MRISTASTSDNVLAQLQRLSTQQAELQNQVATGQRIFKPSDDPAAAARVISAQMERASVSQYARNADAALEYSKTSYSGLDQFKKLSDRAGELAVMGTGNLGTSAMQAYASEVDQLLEQAATSGNTRFRNDYVFGGTAVDTPPFTATRDADGKITAVAYVGDAGRVSVPLADGASIQPTPDAATNSGLADFMNQLVALRDALNAGDTNATQATRAGLDTSENLLVSSLSEHGAIQLRIEVAQTQQRTRLDSIETAISADADVDLTSTIVRLNQTTQAYEAALSSGSTMLKMSLLDYLK
ncbi:MAG: flagellar hook-associated protein FlgL [Verrucomicrobia bacterium]|nr:flagellar hook-associated protein FlgL [Verrucomicrobiota bacterium]